MSDAAVAEVLEKVRPARRERVKALLVNTPFVRPVVASFPLDGKTAVSRILASAGNAT
jgi:hypothetical protein